MNKQGNRKKILVVDDEPTNLKLLEAVLAPRGYILETALNGQEALEKIKTLMPDLVILDIMMPGMDGYEVCKRIKDDGGLPYIPIIFLTAIQADQESITLGLDIGGDDYIRKPFDALELVSRVRAALRVKDLYDKLAKTKAELARYVSLSTLRMVEESRTGPGGIENGQTRDLTALFSDIRGFTDMSQGMAPEEVFETLNLCLSKQIEVVESHHGIVDKLTGDEIMAVFEGPGMAENALRCGMAIVEILRPLKVRHRNDRIEVGIGINTGPVYVGSIGSQTMKDYTAVGTTVNIAARLCGLAEKSKVLFTETTRDFIGPTDFSYRPLGKISLRGMSSPIETFELISKIG